MPEFARAGDFCPNTVCADHGKKQDEGQPNLIKFGRTKAGRQRRKCKTCGQTFTETKGTIFYRRRTPAEKIIETLAFIAEGDRVSSLTRVKGYKEDTILDWLEDTAEHAETIEAELLARYRLQGGQIDGLWAYVGHKGASRDRGKGSVLAQYNDRYG
jgi:transposase-like protein